MSSGYPGAVGGRGSPAPHLLYLVSHIDVRADGKVSFCHSWAAIPSSRDHLPTCFDAELSSVIVLPWQCVLLWVCLSRNTADSSQERRAVQAWGSSLVLPWCVMSRPWSAEGKLSQQRGLSYFDGKGRKIPICSHVVERVLAGEKVLHLFTHTCECGLHCLEI